MIYLQIFFVLFILTVLVLIVMFVKNSSLKKELKVLQEVLAVKDTTIANFEASRVAVKDVIENLSSHEEVMQMVDAGESRIAVSEKLGIPLNKIELIIKFDKIKKEKQK